MSQAAAVRVLIIDDEKGLRDMLSSALRRGKFSVAVAEDGILGVAAALEAEFDVAVCDMMMPRMEGVMVLELLKRERPMLEIVMVTGSPTRETSARCEALGAFAYLAKPYDLLALMAVVQAAAERKRRRAGG